MTYTMSCLSDRTTNYSERLQRAKTAIREAEFILIGAGAGLSDAAGLTYIGKRFTDHFGPFIEKYGMTDLYSSSFYPFRTEEEKWAYWAKHISLNRYETPATQLYKDILALVQDKDYFVITTNVESQFEKAGFENERIFATQGDYRYFQCAKGCHRQVYDNYQIVQEMLESTLNCAIPSELVPHCPTCGGPMDVHLRKDFYFVEDDNWYAANDRYDNFLRKMFNRRVVLLELGVGFNTPGIIRYPFEQYTFANPHATLIRMNRDYPDCDIENKDKTIAFDEDMTKIFEAL